MQDKDYVKRWVVESYDNTYVYIYKGYLSSLKLVEKREHGFDYCPLQGIANNKELMGDAEKVLALIDVMTRYFLIIQTKLKVLYTLIWYLKI
ncbi:MAG: phage portal protein [Lachnospirales bacterium]